MRTDIIIGALLALAVLVVWTGTIRNGFVGSDDDLYVYENPHVLAGLTPSSITWAFTTKHATYWHPVTWMSHMLDVQIFGTNPAGHHATSLLFHLLNTLLLYRLLLRTTGARWRSAAAAALFALHPLRVESVAWIAERKDLLSAFFGLLSIAAYVQFTRERKKWAYAESLFLFALSLASKPMLVTLPFLLLLLDWWPLARLTRSDAKALVVEKLPYLALAAASTLLTFFGTKTVLTLPLAVRLDNAVLSYLRYIGKLFYPAKLAFFYPHSGLTHGWVTVAAALCLLSITVASLYFGRRYRYLAFGWFWYLGALVPVIGLVQVGRQAIADRFTYIPAIGLTVIAAWGLTDLCRGWTWRRAALASATAAGLVVLSAMTVAQIRTWRDSRTLFEHALSVTQNNPFIEIALGRSREAIGHLEQALRARPDSPDTLYALGAALESTGREPEAMERYQEALRLKPEYAEAHSNLGLLLLRRRKPAEALPHLREAARLAADSAQAHEDLATCLGTLGSHDEAARELREAIRLSKPSAPLQSRLALELASVAGSDPARLQEAIAQARTACDLTHWTDPLLLDNLARIQAHAGDFDKALETSRRAVVLAQQSQTRDLAAKIESRAESYRQKRPVPLTQEP